VLRSAKEVDNVSPSILPGPSVYSCLTIRTVKERDGYRCALTKLPHPQAAHIFPCSLPDLEIPYMIPKFWNLLRIFWDQARVEKWKSMIFSDSQNPDIGVERCINLISLAPTAHDMWNRGLFALKPLKLSRNRKKLTVQFFWQVPGNYKFKSRIDLLTEPTSSEGLDIVADGYWLTRLEADGSTPRIRSGEIFTFTTKDPENLPLPSLELLEMQWVLQRLVGMSGAAGWPTFTTDDDDDDILGDNENWLIED
jgi:hypothetical protein